MKNVEDSEFYMVLAFIFASQAEEGAVFVLNDSHFIGASDSKDPCDFSAIKNCLSKSKNYNNTAIMYSTYVPTIEDVKDLIINEVRFLVYFPWFDLPSSVIDLAYKGKVELFAFQGNLNWIRDRVNDLKKIGIFNI